MLKKLIYLCFVLLGFSACGDNWQYDVYVENASGEDLKIEYKTQNAKEGTVEKTMVLPNGGRERLISTIDIDFSKNKSENSAKHCELVAEYINAYKSDTPSKIKWCSNNIKYQTVDIGQGEFTIRYTSKDF